MTPARATGRDSSAMTSMSGWSSTVAAVEEPQALAPPGAPDDDLAAAELPEIEDVDRLARREQNVVRGVHDVVDRAQAHGFEARPQPLRRRPDLDAADDEPAVTGAEDFLQDLDIDGLGGRFGQLRDRPGAMLERAAQEDGDFAGHSDVPERIGPVGVGLDVEDGVPVAVLDGLRHEADHGQPVDELPDGHVEAHVIPEPVQMDLHRSWNCLLNRRSFSKKSRSSGIW